MPLNINFSFNFGVMLLVIYVCLLLTGFFCTFFYNNYLLVSFKNLILASFNIFFFSSLRCFHNTIANLFFLLFIFILANLSLFVFFFIDDILIIIIFVVYGIIILFKLQIIKKDKNEDIKVWSFDEIIDRARKDFYDFEKRESERYEKKSEKEIRKNTEKFWIRGKTEAEKNNDPSEKEKWLEIKDMLKRKKKEKKEKLKSEKLMSKLAADENINTNGKIDKKRNNNNKKNNNDVHEEEIKAKANPRKKNQNLKRKNRWGQ